MVQKKNMYIITFACLSSC